MEINCLKFRKSLINLKKLIKCEDENLENFLRLISGNHFNKTTIDKIFNYLSDRILDFDYTIPIGLCFDSTILLIVIKTLQNQTNNLPNFHEYQRYSIALSKLIKICPNLLNYVKKFFLNKPIPFKISAEDDDIEIPLKKRRKSLSKNYGVDFVKEIIKSFYRLLSGDAKFFQDLWDWSVIFDFPICNNDLEIKFYLNHVIGILTNMSQIQLNELMSSIPEQELIELSENMTFNADLQNLLFEIESDNSTNEAENKSILWEYDEINLVTNVEGILLEIFNVENAKQFEKNSQEIVLVDSTRINLRSIALGIIAQKAIRLTGPVGCGKTSLIEYLAKKSGRIFFKKSSNDKCLKEHNANNTISYQTDNIPFTEIEKFKTNNGFLRIQLGDQTDSKMLLGQYICSDVPGQFVWSPGVLTQAVMNGYWLLLEDLDSATSDTFTVLNNLLETNTLNVPGFSDSLKIKPGFQLFVTTRSNTSSQKLTVSLLEKHLYTIFIHPLTKKELSQVITINYPKLSTIATRIVDVYLEFARGNHSDHFKNFLIKEQNRVEENGSTIDYIPLPFDNVSMQSLKHSTRLVSTRDLMKLCHRSVPMFSATSAECAYFIFQNATDVFCSYLPASHEKLKLIIGIGAKLGIIQSRCEFFTNEYKPDITLDFDLIKIGRVEILSKKTLSNQDDNQLTDVTPIKKIKLNNFDQKSMFSHGNLKETFSFTRISACLLEKVAVCINQNEPILLVGETGVGKTSSVQYLAGKTQHKLIVINMNNQSDVSDLVGGFKPVDLSYVIAPLRSQFEAIFSDTFTQAENEKFLSLISVQYNLGNFSVVVKLMLRIIVVVFERSQQNQLNLKNEMDISKNWRKLHEKLLKLDSQLKKSLNISFAFIPGSLVKCIQNGDWILLDEINLASAETLECLSTILEPDGSVVLLERGDFTPIKRHLDFRIFACMNPNTDIGKKDLPIGIRNRFTEFYVDDLTTDNDLLLLVNDYLQNTGIKRAKVLNIVKLYKKLKSLSQLELNDGLGNRPVFSLRTLCRALKVCAKNLCGSIERNLYESFCMSFLTQLEPISHKIVLDLIKLALLSDNKAVLGQLIPKPGENYSFFEGYWIQQGSKSLQNCENYILTESVKSNLKDLARIISIGKLPILLQGPTSAGKTSLIEFIARTSGNTCLRINNHEHTDLQEYLGTYVPDTNGKLAFKEGVLVQAMRNGYWIILDELNLASTEILEALNRLLDDNRELFIPETQKLVKAHPNFMLFATQNPPGLYGGRKTLSRAFKNRFIELHFSEIPKNELEIILEKRCLIPNSYAKKMVSCMTELQLNRKTVTKSNFTLRDLFRWGNRYTYADKKLLDIKSYDWNQHLVDEGFLVLSAKLRNNLEIEIIEEALFKNFRKKITRNNLYHLGETTSLVTKSILEQVKEYNIRFDIVWTENMIRMIVLTAKAIQFNEPVLLVGPTGCGKTTICQILADIEKNNLRILNCHMHTEGADFLGGMRPYRNSDNSNEKQLFEWANGPLVLAMQEGSYFMADEISLAEDSVLERLNCVLEPERTLLLAEKSSLDTEISNEYLIVAKKDFQFLATMNPGGDFGKKELSPALRNRFTEIWCTPSDSRDDLIEITSNFLLKIGENHKKCARLIIDIIFYLKENIEKLKFSIRDLQVWCDFILKNTKTNEMSIQKTLIYGLELTFLDSLEMLPFDSEKQIIQLKMKVMKYAINQINETLLLNLNDYELHDKYFNSVQIETNKFGIKPFFIETKNPQQNFNNKFFFDVPTTKTNLFRLLSALSLQKPILLEGSPGIGKTSLVENLANAIGYKLVRINLCEHTDLCDLFGTDLPAVANDENSLTNTSESNNEFINVPKLGAFEWRDGPLLAALKSENTWILLDELNLAPQSVLEGLNAILDHRGEVYIPELNKKFYLKKDTRIFACQNPLRQGGGRKGLPQSFLNRFIKAYLQKLNTNDMLNVVQSTFKFDKLQKYFEKFVQFIDTGNKTNLFEILSERNTLAVRKEPCFDASLIFDLPLRMVKFSEKLEKGIQNLQFGYRGGPFEINLRDILVWCELLLHEETGFILNNENISNDIGNIIVKKFLKSFDNFILVLYEKMKLVYYQRMRTEQDKKFIRDIFNEIFESDAEQLNQLSEDIGVYWTDTEIHINDIVLKRNHGNSLLEHGKELLVLKSQRELLKNLVECTIINKPVILCGPTDTGKTKAIEILRTLSNSFCNYDIIDDSVTGSFQQIDLNRHLNDIADKISYIVIENMKILALSSKDKSHLQNLFKSWNHFSNLKNNSEDLMKSSNEIALFRDKIRNLNAIIENLTKIHLNKHNKTLRNLTKKLMLLNHIVINSDSLNTGGNFEWVDSKIVKALKYGEYICLEHVNLCSPAVLDRLNPLFEPNGTLLLSEKGVTNNNEPDIVQKHKNYRAFLTMDPKNGELSRAMRNRCIELALIKNSYTIYDLKLILYSNGITNNYTIDCLLKIHHRLKEISDLNSFDVSHLIKFAFLMSSYKKLGYSVQKSIYYSGIEVYVYSSNSDLLGFGLEFYHDKLRQVIEEESQHFNINHSNRLLIFDYNCNNLNKISMIKLQCQPFEFLLNQLEIGQDNHSKAILFSMSSINIPEELEKFDLENNFNLCKFYIYLLYDCCTFDDLSTRAHYLKKILIESKLNPTHIENLQTLSNQLKEIVKKRKHLFDSSNQFLPWNSKTFPRIRKYKQMIDQNNVELRTSALLFSDTIINKIAKENLSKLNQATALTYSQSVETKMLTDNLNNVLLNKLSKFLELSKLIIDSTLTTTDLDMKKFVEIILNLLWFNRLIDCSKNRIFIEKQLNENVINELYLHFNWLDKNMLKQYCNSQINNEFNLILIEIRNYIKKVTTIHPLSLIQKKYYKSMIKFDPIYSEERLTLFKLKSEYENLINLNASSALNHGDKNNYDGKLNIILSDESEKFKTVLSRKNFEQIFTIIKRFDYEIKHKVSEIDSHKREILFHNNIESEKNGNSDTISNMDIDSLQNILKVLHEKTKSLNSKQIFHKFDLELQILKEYFMVKCMKSLDFENMNSEYYENIRTLNCTSLELFKIINTKEFQNFFRIYFDLFNIESKSTLNSIQYKNYSTFFRLIIYSFQNYILRQNSFESYLKMQDTLNCENNSIHNGSYLTNLFKYLLFDSNTGEFKQIGLIEIEKRKYQLEIMRSILWNNMNLNTNQLKIKEKKFSFLNQFSKKLLNEIKIVYDRNKSVESNINEYFDFMDNFNKLQMKLKTITTLELTENNISENSNSKTIEFIKIQNIDMKLSFLASIIGSIEIILFSFTPIIDPVKKKSLKYQYLFEDKKCLEELKKVYEIMRNTLQYENFGCENYSEFLAKIKEIEFCKRSYSGNVPLRPENCLYSNFVEDLKHFLHSYCTPKNLLYLIENAEHCFKSRSNPSEISECIKKISLWILNAKQFTNHTLQKYTEYYQDFIQPVECSIGMTVYGFEHIKSTLTQLESILIPTPNINKYVNLNEDGKICRVFENLIQFPSTNQLENINIGKFLAGKTGAENFENTGDFLSFRLLKAKLHEIKNSLVISLEINENIFYQFEKCLSTFNALWQQQEDRRKHLLAEEESLYVQKIRCETENEEEIEMLEIREKFPVFVDEDFGEFITEVSLEKVIGVDKNVKKKQINVIVDNDIKFLGEMFIHVMETFTKNHLYSDTRNSLDEPVDFVRLTIEKCEIFIKLFQHFETSMNEWLDEKIYNIFSFVIGLQQQMLDQLIIQENPRKSYNFYKDSNISEILNCSDIMTEIELKANEQLELYPDHAVLNDINLVINRIRHLPSTSSLARFNTGFQILRQKISQWNEVAHKNNNMINLEVKVAEFVQKWTKSELQFWRNCLIQTQEKVESNAYKYWFFIYNLLHEFLNEIDSNYVSFNDIEKKIEDENYIEPVDKKRIQENDIVTILQQFMESSNYGDYLIRLKLLKSFAFYLTYISKNGKKKEILISILLNLEIYYSQFSDEINEKKQQMKIPIEKKLREFVKIESYNKDLSYFSMRNNVAKVHRNLNKFCKQFETELKVKISEVFQVKDNQSKEYNFDHNEKGGKILRYESKMKYYMIDAKNFISSPQKQKSTAEKEEIFTVNDDNSILNRLEKLHITARGITQKMLSNAQYPSLIYALDLLLFDQIENCDYLRKLEIDRIQERPKQILQAKTISQQKRKALSELFKTLSKLGLNFKTGLMEISTRGNEDINDFHIKPFSIQNMFKTKLSQNLKYLSKNLNLYYGKCIFKLKQLQNIMLQPQSEIGPANIDRIKGFSIDMFLLVQNQRKLLSNSLSDVHHLHQICLDLQNLRSYFMSNTGTNFLELDNQFLQLKYSFNKILFVFEQFNLFIKCAPETINLTTMAVIHPPLVKDSDMYKEVSEKSKKIIQTCKMSLEDLQKLKDSTFLCGTIIQKYMKIKENIVTDITYILEKFSLDSLTDLLKCLHETPLKELNTDLKNVIVLENVNLELENVVHLILISIQKLYKKYTEILSSGNSIDSDSVIKTPDKELQVRKQEEIQDNHLKLKIFKELQNDISNLNIETIYQRMSNILLCIKYEKNLNIKTQLIQKSIKLLPILEQYSLIGDYFIFQQLGAHKITSKMLSVMLTVFIELGSKGFCIPADLMQDEEGEIKNKDQSSGGFGLEDGLTGENDVSDKIENEDQLDDAKRPEDRKDNKNEENNSKCDEEKNGIEMSEDFDADMQDVNKSDEEQNDKSENEDDGDLDKEMGETNKNCESLDDQIWGSDTDEKDEQDNEDLKEDENGKGNNEENDQHNEINSENDTASKMDDQLNQQENGLDATNTDNKDKNKQDIEEIKDAEGDDNQTNPYHNELEEPPQAEEMNLDENFNLDEDGNENNADADENPFDIDKMKEQMEVNDDENNKEDAEETNDEKNNEFNDSESENELDPEAGLKDDNNTNENDNKNSDYEDNEVESNLANEKLEENDEVEEDNTELENKMNPLGENNESKDKNASKEDNIQTVMEEKQTGSSDQVENSQKEQSEQSSKDEQDTGNEKDGIGQAENENTDKGHQAVTDSKKTNLDNNNKNNSKNEEKNKLNKANEERTIAEKDKNIVNQLKTVDKIKNSDEQENRSDADDTNDSADEYQHIKEAKKNEKTTIDTATEEQSKSILDLEKETENQDDIENEEVNEDLIDENDQKLEENVEEVDNLVSEKNRDQKKSDNPSKTEKTKEKCEPQEPIEIEGVLVDTHHVSRSDETSAHCMQEIVFDNSPSYEMPAIEQLQLRQMYQNQLFNQKIKQPGSIEFEYWQEISGKMSVNARELCEQLRLILEPTKCTRLKGDYRTGRRINMKKIIPYIASQFRKDKIWLRRTKPAQRDYKISIAIDDSKSMHHNNSKDLTLQAISLISQALTLLESGKLNIVSFGEAPQIILNHSEQFDGPKLIKFLNFEQSQSRIAELLDFIRTINLEEGNSSSDNGIFENLVLVLSDGRNIFSEGKQKVKNSVKLARLQRMFLVYIIIDNPENKHSILDIREPIFSSDGKVTMKSYLDTFPFPYYVIVRDLNQLPIVLSEAMRQWFELVNSDQ